MKLFNLIEIRYNQLTNAIKNYLSKELVNNNTAFGNNTIFGQLITVLSAAIQNIMLYIEDAMTEQNIFTAQRKKSIYGLAAQTGYIPSLGEATKIQLKMNFIPNNIQNSNIIINNKTPLTCTQNGLTYNLLFPQESIVISMEKDLSSKYITAVQGRFESQIFTSIGGMFYTQNIKFLGNLDVNFLEVRINNEIWERVDSLYDMKPEGHQYCYKISPISGIDLIFGNDKFGKSLKDGDIIKITYLLHDGELGNVDINSDTVFIFNDALQDISGEEIDGNNIFKITFATSDAVSIGSNSESIEQTRQMIGLNSRSLVLISPESYKNYISRFSFCGYNRTWSEPGSLIFNSLIMKNYSQLLNTGNDYFNLKESDFTLTPEQKNSIYESILKSGRQLAGSVYNIYDPKLCKYSLYLYIKLKDTENDKDYIKNQIRVAVGNFFGNIQNDQFIPKSDIAHYLKTEIKDIDGVSIYILSEKNETAIINGKYTKEKYIYNNKTGKYDLTKQEVVLYPGENPMLGLNSHGDILLNNNSEFPVLMGGWSFKQTETHNRYNPSNHSIIKMNDDISTITVIDPLTIVFE